MDLLETNKYNKRHPWELARIAVVKDMISKYLDENTPDYVLDIGSGDVYMAHQLSLSFTKLKFICIDIGYSDEDIKHYKEQYPNLLIYNNQEALKDLNKNAALVLLLDVVEHVKNDIEFLEIISQYKSIGPDTLFLITVPAFQHLFVQHDVFLKHYRRYSNSSIKRVVTNARLEKIEYGYFFSSLLSIRFLQKMIEKMQRKKVTGTGLSDWNGSAGFTSFVKNVLYYDYKFFNTIRSITGLRVPGLSNFILCKKASVEN